MSELLSPSGTKEAFYAAISNGADAIYLGLDRFSARAYASNFTIESLKELVPFAHLRNVKIYVTINTIIYDDELSDVYKTIDELASIGVDGIIAQDLAVISYITNHYQSLHAHASTQMGIDDLDAALLCKELGISRVVFARETSIEQMKQIKEKTNLEVEAFIHGALCVSYSGNCYMSSAIGDRSGNRGRCAGCCRKAYSLIDLDSKEKLKEGYLLSMKDLNTIDHLDKMDFVDSLKIEGRMKEPSYVAAITRTYRKKLDNDLTYVNNLEKVFNRTFTKGFMNGETSLNITNIEKPNNNGYLIGEVIKQYKNQIYIRLNKTLSKGDQIRIDTNSIYSEISIFVSRLFDMNFNQIDSSDKKVMIYSDKKVEVGAKVYKTKDSKYLSEIEETFRNKEYKKLPLDMEISAKIGKPLFIKAKYQNNKAFAKSDFIIEASLTSKLTKENLLSQIAKLNDSPYSLGHTEINMDENIFIPVSKINEVRRQIVENMNASRLEAKVVRSDPKEIMPLKHELHEPIITVEVNNETQYNAVKELGIKHIYYKNIIRRNNANYKDIEDEEVLAGGLGGIHHYLNKNKIVTDYSLNVVNHIQAGILSSLGVDRITLSEEMSKDKINKLVINYINEFKTYPNFELIIYGRSKIMHSKYCPLKRLGMCGECKKHNFALKDEYATFPLKFNDDCTINLLNSRNLNLMDELDDLKGINYYRISFFDESKEEITKIITSIQNKLKNHTNNLLFNKDKDTHGHFLKNPL